VSENPSGAGAGDGRAPEPGAPDQPNPPGDATTPESTAPEYAEPPPAAPYEASVVQPTDYPAQMGAVARGAQMKRRNPVAAWIGLPLITLGIYHFVWYYKIHAEMQDFDRRRKIPTIGPVLVLILLGWTVIAPLISYYRTGERIVESQRAAGIPTTCMPIIGLLLTFVFGLNTLYYQIELNKVVDAYGGKATPPGTVVPLRV
jgi:hypothetical protein